MDKNYKDVSDISDNSWNNLCNFNQSLCDGIDGLHDYGSFRDMKELS